MTSAGSESQAGQGRQFAFVQQKIKRRFQIQGKIGSGAYGHVWRVRCRLSGQTFALKKVFLAFQNETDAQRVYRQVGLLSKLRHGNVIRLREVLGSEGGGDVYLVLQFMQSDLFKAVKNRVLDQTHKKYIVYQLACGLKYLHGVGVLHRDLKPSNVLLDSGCKVKLCDFGLSRTLTSEYFNRPVMTEFIATRWYRAPEVLLGSRSYSTKSDMWSLGCLIYELYSRRTLLPGENTIDQITKIVEFKGKPTAEQLQSLRADKAGEILSFFQVQRRERDYYYGDLECGEIGGILEHLFEYDPERRWSADQLLQSSFLREFRDPESEAAAEGEVVLELNDNRKYKLERYREEILRLTNTNTAKQVSAAGSAKRFLFSCRSGNQLSLHGAMANLKPKISTTLRGKGSKEKKFKSANVSPDRKGSAGKSFASLHCNPRGSSLRSTFKQQSQHIETRLLGCSTLHWGGEKENGKVKGKERGKRQVSRGRGNLGAAKVYGVLQRASKQNYESKLRLLKREKIKHYRDEGVPK